jgi:hypothetical protein
MELIQGPLSSQGFIDRWPKVAALPLHRKGSGQALLSLRYEYLCGKPHRVPERPIDRSKIGLLHKANSCGEITGTGNDADNDAKTVRGYSAVTSQAPIIV